MDPPDGGQLPSVNYATEVYGFRMHPSASADIRGCLTKLELWMQTRTMQFCYIQLVGVIEICYHQ